MAHGGQVVLSEQAGAGGARDVDGALAAQGPGRRAAGTALSTRRPGLVRYSRPSAPFNIRQHGRSPDPVVGRDAEQRRGDRVAETVHPSSDWRRLQVRLVTEVGLRVAASWRRCLLVDCSPLGTRLLAAPRASSIAARGTPPLEDSSTTYESPDAHVRRVRAAHDAVAVLVPRCSMLPRGGGAGDSREPAPARRASCAPLPAARAGIESAAVELLVNERGLSGRARLTHSRAVVMTLCRRLDGLPLARDRGRAEDRPRAGEISRVGPALRARRLRERTDHPAAGARGTSDWAPLLSKRRHGAAWMPSYGRLD